MYKVPLAYRNNTGNKIFEMLTENIEYLISDGYNLLKAFEVDEKPEYGTYLDYGAYNHTDIFEIALGPKAHLDESLIILEALNN